MKNSKTEKLLSGGIVVILLSVLAIVQMGEFCHKEKLTDDEDQIDKGYRLCGELKYEEAYGCFRSARLKARLLAGDIKRELKALKGLADCSFWMGEVDNCIHHYNQALVLAKMLNEQREEYDICTKLKQAYRAKADMKNVLNINQSIDSILNVTDNNLIRMDQQRQLAMEALQQQNEKLAEHYLLANEHFIDSLSVPDQQLAKYTVYWDLREFYLGQQDYEKARKYCRLYIEHGKQGLGQNLMIYICYGIEAVICAQQEDRRAAFAALDTMKYGIEKLPETNEAHIMNYHTRKGMVHAEFEEWKQAGNEFEIALKTAEGTNIVGRANYYQVGRMWADALCKQKKYDEARNAYSLCWEYCKYQYGEESMACADILIALANMEEQSGETEAGKRCYTMATDICKGVVSQQLRYISVQERNSFWSVFAPWMFSMTAYAMRIGERQSQFTEKCYEALLFSKALLLESDRTMAVAINNDCTPEEQHVYYEMLGLQNQLKGLMNDYEKNKERIGDLHERISRQNQRLTPIISKLGYTSFLSQGYEDIKQTLKEDEVLLDFTDYESDEEVQQFACFVVDRKQENPKLVKSFTEDSIKILLGGKPTDFLYKEPYASKAVNMVWNPLAKEVKGKKTVYYVPSGILHRIALESLPLSDGSLLGEHYHFVRLTSAREIAKLRGRTRIAQNAAATLYGALKYDIDTKSMVQEALRYKVEPILAYDRGETIKGDARFKELPNTKEEIDKIGRILMNSRLRVTAQTGMEGTEESFLALSGNAPQILHVATHGFYYTPEKAKNVSYLNGYNDAMLLSGLIMAGGNRAWMGRQVPEGVLGGVMTANSIANMNLKGTDLLVLSACQTGLGVATPEGIFGLQRAFKKAGVQTMVMTLWSVDDEATKDFMVKFYEELAVNHWNKRVAFEKAKEFVRGKTYIRNGKSYKGDPYYWAGFVMLD